MNRFLFVSFASACIGLCGIGCSRNGGEGPGDRPTVFVSILPQKYLAERIAGDRIAVEALIGKGQTPHTFDPSLKQTQRLAGAEAWFTIGLPFEEAVANKLRPDHPDLDIVPTDKGIDKRRFTPAEMARHADGHNGGHDGHDPGDRDHGPVDPHVWLNPLNAKVIASTVAEELIAIDPDGAKIYRNNLDDLHADLDALDRELADALEPLRGETLFVFHPAFGYFADRYGLEQVAVEVEGRQPTLKELNNLIARARRENAAVIFVQPQFATDTVRTLARQVDAAVVTLNPLAENYIENMREIARKVSAVNRN